ncbi:MAG TPA: thermonuclease family protein [Chloroflexota bacterium]|nr:thermonuclease family protein [Chloroflexota bacterium]HUM68014.1 thermonuclease family protein [Chloroflexota bacterium]
MLNRTRNLSRTQKIVLAITAVWLIGCVTCCAWSGLIAHLTSTRSEKQTLAASGEEVSGELAAGELAAVTRIIDGDTIEVEINGRTYRVRYIGMDTPERGDPFFDEATAANRQLVEGQTVTMVKDVSETDRYGRLLRYIYLADGTFVNAELVRQGYAQIATFPPDVAHQELFVQLQQEARDAGLGLWGKAAATLPPASQTPQPASPTLPPSTHCDPSYPTVCIPPPPPDLNCGSIPHQNFTVLEPDPHGFDRDNDGVGCES